MNAGQGFAFHPLAAQDITDIWEYIAADIPFAARRVREEIYGANSRRRLVSQHRPHTPRPHLTALALHSGARISDRLWPG